ncbi:MAG TPA: hypothetical protein VK427_12650, partial [Kofleriaceae bacterium]|nr:hypothetical protein [Kofleriaceae bacterium]
MRLALVALAVLASSAGADPARPTRVTVRLDGETARFAARYVITTHAQRAETSHYALPAGGLVTGATITQARQRHVLSLVPADEART